MNQDAEKEAENLRQLPWTLLPVKEAQVGFGMFSDVTVLDLSTSVAGPYAAMLLSDFGANIIKIERPSGDDARSWGPPFLNGQSLWFTAMNRNKKSVVLDLNAASGRAAFEALLTKADVLVTNQPPDIQRKLKLDYESLQKHNAGLVFVSITGFGMSGDRADLTCYDLIAEGYSGIMELTGASEGAPQKIGAPAADMLAGQDAAMATMAALYEKHKSGKGAKIDISLVESMTRLSACRLSSYLGSGEVPTRSGGTDSVIAIYQSFETADKPINLGLGTDAIWSRFWNAVGDKEFGTRESFSTNAGRRENRLEIVSRIHSILISRKSVDWLELFAQNRIPAGPINGVAEIVHDKAVQDRGLFYALRDGAKLVPQVGLGIQIDGKSAIARSAPPTLGEHNEEVLSQQ